MRDPLPHRTEPCGDEVIATLSAVPLLRHEAGDKQDAIKVTLPEGNLILPMSEQKLAEVKKAADGSMVTITGEVSGGLITLVVRNPLAPSPGMREGNRLALANIRERLSLLYGERALMKSGRFDDEYIVTLRFPLLERAAAASA